MSTLVPSGGWPDPDLADLRRAVSMLEQDHFVTRLSGLIGRGFDASAGMAARFLPNSTRATIQDVVGKALGQAADMALATVDKTGRGVTGVGVIDRALSSRWFGSAAVALTGAGGGAAGVAGTLVEFPITTTLMMRSILDIARAEGEDLSRPEAKLACLEVFALGGPSESDDPTESAYFAVRLGMAQLFRQAAGSGIEAVLPRAVALVATRFGVPAGWKFAGQAVPAVGAAAGALINVAFIDHFQQKARGHFIVRRLERTHGEEAVRRAYEAARFAWLESRQAA